MKRWKAILEEYNYELHYKQGRINEISTLTSSEHSDESSSHGLIYLMHSKIKCFF